MKDPEEQTKIFSPSGESDVSNRTNVSIAGNVKGNPLLQATTTSSISDSESCNGTKRTRPPIVLGDLYGTCSTDDDVLDVHGFRHGYLEYNDLAMMSAASRCCFNLASSILISTTTQRRPNKVTVFEDGSVLQDFSSDSELDCG